MPKRRFDKRKGDRVARQPGRDVPTLDLDEAMTYARMRAITLCRRQYVRPHRKHGWYVVINTEKELNNA